MQWNLCETHSPLFVRFPRNKRPRSDDGFHIVVVKKADRLVMITVFVRHDFLSHPSLSRRLHLTVLTNQFFVAHPLQSSLRQKQVSGQFRWKKEVLGRLYIHNTKKEDRQEIFQGIKNATRRKYFLLSFLSYTNNPTHF